MSPSHSTPERPRDIIDDVEDACGQEGCVAEVSPEYYEAFLALSDDEIEALARTVLVVDAREARRLTFVEPVSEAPNRLIGFTRNTLSIIAIGLFRFNDFGQLRVYKRIGPEPEPDVYDALKKKIAKAHPIIELAVRDFIQQQEAGLPSAKEPDMPARESGLQTHGDPDVESARIRQFQLSLFPRTPREVCGRTGLNWLAACQLHADGWLSFDPRSVGTLNEAQEAELELVGPLVAAGCDAELLARLLHGLRRPYQYRASSIYLDWAAGCWRLLPGAEEPNPPQVFADRLDSLKESGDRQQLEEIARDVAVVLRSLPEEEPEPN